jgi:hypothetical protein
MSDVMAIFGIVLLLGLTYPGMLTTWRMLFPSLVERSGTRLAVSPWKSAAFGLIMVVGFTSPALMLVSLPFGLAKMIGWLIIAGGLMIASLGAAGLASLIGERLGQLSGPGRSAAAVFIRGAVALELAAAFPIIGWFFFLPVSTLTATGAAAFAVLNWMPRISDLSSAELRSSTNPTTAATS